MLSEVYIMTYLWILLIIFIILAFIFIIIGEWEVTAKYIIIYIYKYNNII